MATAPVLGYVMQYRLIQQNQSVGGFSIDICLVLLVANILRLNFYPFNQFDTALLFQSFFMIVAQLLLLQTCSQYKDYNKERDSSTAASEEEDITENFWRWNSFTPFCSPSAI
jgi:solute carrier family 66, member 2